jgi:uncharacterized Zn finger protein
MNELEAKANRLLAESSIRIMRKLEGEVEAWVRGDHGYYRVTLVDDFWRCDCPAIGRCSHCAAVAKVVAVPVDERTLA